MEKRDLKNGLNTGSAGFHQPTVDTSSFDNEVRARAEANRLKAATRGVVVEPAAAAAQAAPATVAQPATQGRFARAGSAAKSALGTVGRVAGAAAGLSGAYDMATGETPADQVAGGLKALAAVPFGPAQVVGGAALVGDQLLQSKTGKGLGHYLDKLAQLHPDYMGSSGQVTAATQPASPPAASDPSYDRKELRSALGNVAGRQELDNPNIRGLRQAGVTGALINDVTQNGKTPATGIRTIDTPNGKVFAGRDASGQLVVNSNVTGGDQAAADAARDKQFAAAGYGKDAYGNWMTPQRLADKQALADIQSERAQFAAFSDQITDPKARSAGLRKVAFDMQNKELDNKAFSEAAKLALDQAKFGQEERKITNLQGNSDREFAQKQASEHNKRVDDILKAKATQDGKLNGEMYSRLQEYAGNFKSDFKEGTAAYYKDLMDNLGVDAAFGADEGGLFRSVRAQGTDVAQGLRQQDGALWGKYLEDPATNRRVSFSNIAKLPPGQQKEMLSRVGDQTLRAQLLQQFGLNLN